MRKLIIGAAAVLLLGTAAWADDSMPPAKNKDPAVGIGMICNTSQQAERFLALRANGREDGSAMQTVNTEANNPHACGLAAIAYVPDGTVGSKTVGAKLLNIVRIHVIAGYNGANWEQVTGMIQYAVIEAKGLEI